MSLSFVRMLPDSKVITYRPARRAGLSVTVHIFKLVISEMRNIVKVDQVSLVFRVAAGFLNPNPPRNETRVTFNGRALRP